MTRENYDAKGLCTRCGNKRDGKHLYCSTCRKKHTESMKRCRNDGPMDPMMGFDNTVPMEPPVQDPDYVEPTEHRPGSDDKIGVLCLRYDLGLPLFSPADAEGARGK